MSIEGDEASPGCARQARQTMAVLAASTDVFETFFERARIGLALADLTTRYVRVNDTYAELLGRAPEDLIGVPFLDLLHPDDRALERSHIDALLRGGETSLQSEERYVAPDGRSVWVLHGVTVVPDPEGRPSWFAVSAQDITERRRIEGELRELTAALTERAVRDPLTGLANRSLLQERLRAVLSRDGRSGASTAVLFLDLNGFKAVNDAWGHAVGDAVLSTVARRLAAAVRPSDTVARIGGDEFVVLVEGATGESVDKLVERLRRVVAEPIVPQDVEVGVSIQVGVSIGMAVSRGGEAEPHALLEAADARMYEDKRRTSGQT